MGEEMGLTHLQETLRSLCFKSEWKYAVFWKLKHRTRMMLTWEDAYYANHEVLDRPDETLFDDNAPVNLRDGRYLQDPLGLSVAKMSYLVYSLGEGIIGQVAVTGKHQWIFADKPTSRCWSSSEYCDGWQTQFSAGIKTIAVVAVVPHGVVQLGSLHTVAEDIKLVTRIKDVFYSLQSSSMKTIPYPICYTTQSSSCLTEVSARVSGSEVFSDFPTSCRKIDAKSYSLPSHGILNDVHQGVLTLPCNQQKRTVEVASEHVGIESTVMRDYESTQANSGIYSLEQQKSVQMESNNREMCEEPNIESRSMFVTSRNHDSSNCSEDPYIDSFIFPLDEFVNYRFLSSRIPDATDGDEINFDKVTSLQKEELPLSQPFEMEITESAISCTNTANTYLRFSAGCELHEALGPAFKKHKESCSLSGSERTEAEITEPLERTSSSLFTTEAGSDYLLEAVIVNSCALSTNNTGSGNAFCKSAESLLTTGKTSETHNSVKLGNALAKGSVIHPPLSLEDTHRNLKLIWDSTEVSNMRSSKESSSRTPSTSSKHSEMKIEPSKLNRKRARPGESCRPRPRDRQLIQDRVKELRELVPNGSKCSIDSLLERTIKHMFFLQNVTKHADKLKKCAESKVRDNKVSLLGSCSHDHGSSWALDVGGQAERCPLVVENLSVDGQMLVEMLCEECSSFLEIAEAIRSLGLTILKGVTETRGENMWACFVVEGNNNRGMHRMDVLWSLVQLLQPKHIV
ncbi:hypothetical protein IFM89_017965 [Coptis chinensis]|uniref:BHLH domain-containing protein n=1 Tax=Coptis chinensis TaxID=261450 RepID=A0A835HWS2_9MAGN|nr:hypothetical protein IFM89_017965 [Coptis chinensis]